MQVEVLEEKYESNDESETLQYLKTMNEPVSLAEIPGRIIRRYTENLNFIIQSVNSFIELLSSSDNILQTFT